MSITLFCLVQGAPTAFPVDIDSSLTVGHLKDAIKAKNTNDFANIDAVKLRLWKVEIPVGNDVIQGQALEDNNQLPPTDYLDEHWTDTPLRKHIHVIIKLPEPAPPSPALASETNQLLKRKLDEFEELKTALNKQNTTLNEQNTTLNEQHTTLKDLLQKIDGLQNDRKTISISRITQEPFKEFLAEHNMQSKLMEINLSLTEKQVNPFVWSDKKEDTNSDRYMKWLNANVTIPSYVTLYKTSNQGHLLSLLPVSTHYKFNGTLDMAIVDIRYVKKGASIAPGLLVGIEVKKEVEAKHHMQATIELLLANVVSQYPVIMLLTDLRNNWTYFWLQKGTVAYDVLELSRGVALLGLITSELKPSSSGELVLSASTSSDAPYRNRCSFLAATSPDDVHETTTPSDGREILKRPKIDPMTFLPEDDIADMRQVFDVMSPSEVYEWKSRKVLEYFMQTPAYQSMCSRK